jgi:hypothetical protein
MQDTLWVSGLLVTVFRFHLASGLSLGDRNEDTQGSLSHDRQHMVVVPEHLICKDQIRDHKHLVLLKVGAVPLRSWPGTPDKARRKGRQRDLIQRLI